MDGPVVDDGRGSMIDGDRSMVIDDGDVTIGVDLRRSAWAARRGLLAAVTVVLLCAVFSCAVVLSGCGVCVDGVVVREAP